MSTIATALVGEEKLSADSVLQATKNAVLYAITLAAGVASGGFALAHVYNPFALAVAGLEPLPGGFWMGTVVLLGVVFVVLVVYHFIFVPLGWRVYERKEDEATLPVKFVVMGVFGWLVMSYLV